MANPELEMVVRGGGGVQSPLKLRDTIFGQPLAMTTKSLSSRSREAKKPGMRLYLGQMMKGKERLDLSALNCQLEVSFICHVVAIRVPID